jgi:hypothetical protein
MGWPNQIDSGARPDARREPERLLSRLWEQNARLGKQPGARGQLLRRCQEEGEKLSQGNRELKGQAEDLKGRLDKAHAAHAQQRRDAEQLHDMRTKLEGLEHRRSRHLTGSVKCFTGDELLKWGRPAATWGHLAEKGAGGVAADLFPVVGGLLCKDKVSGEDGFSATSNYPAGASITGSSWRCRSTPT